LIKEGRHPYLLISGAETNTKVHKKTTYLFFGIGLHPFRNL